MEVVIKALCLKFWTQRDGNTNRMLSEMKTSFKLEEKRNQIGISYGIISIARLIINEHQTFKVERFWNDRLNQF